MLKKDNAGTPTRVRCRTARPAAWLPSALLVMALALLGACATTDSPPVEPKAVDNYLGNNEITKMNEMILAQVSLNEDPGDYLLGKGDLLKISVFEAEELDATVRVSSRGFITLPLIETVAVKGLTVMEAEEQIEAMYRQRYIKNPHVAIFVEEHISQRITLVGQFQNPGHLRLSHQAASAGCHRSGRRFERTRPARPCRSAGPGRPRDSPRWSWSIWTG